MRRVCNLYAPGHMRRLRTEALLVTVLGGAVLVYVAVQVITTGRDTMRRNQREEHPFESPSGSYREEAAMPYEPDAENRSPGQGGIEDVRGRNERWLMSIDGVEGVSIGRTPTGDSAIVLYLRDRGALERVPRHVDGYPVQTTVTGPIQAY